MTHAKLAIVCATNGNEAATANAAREGEVMSEWQPIETAPYRGKWVLLWWPAVTDAPFVGYCYRGEWRSATSGDTWPTLAGPTHWQPLPPPPGPK